MSTPLRDDLLDVSRITSKRFTMQLEPLRLANAVVVPVVEAVRPLLVARSLRMRIAADAACAWVRGDEVRLVQALSNVPCWRRVAAGAMPSHPAAPGARVRSQPAAPCVVTGALATSRRTCTPQSISLCLTA